MLQVNEDDLSLTPNDATQSGGVVRVWWRRLWSWLGVVVARSVVEDCRHRLAVAHAMHAEAKRKHATETRKMKAEIDALTAEKTALAKLHVGVMAMVEAQTAEHVFNAKRFKQNT
ncbi:MAG: hypothetical protein ACRC7O_05185 [Fimbriiglobus sp.]